MLFSGERNLFHKCAGITGYSQRKKTNLDLYLMPYTKLNFKWITVLTLLKARYYKAFR